MKLDGTVCSECLHQRLHRETRNWLNLLMEFYQRQLIFYLFFSCFCCWLATSWCEPCVWTIQLFGPNINDSLHGCKKVWVCLRKTPAFIRSCKDERNQCVSDQRWNEKSNSEAILGYWTQRGDPETTQKHTLKYGRTDASSLTHC